MASRVMRAGTLLFCMILNDKYMRSCTRTSVDSSMPTGTPSARLGPVPSEDVDGKVAAALQERPPEGLGDLAGLVTSLLSKMEVNLTRRFMPRPDDVIIRGQSSKRGST
ncbi:hypothetical protein GUJ93_ZPchr0006g42436 [Zizania palustris]|uniref:Uncharacterized protein n=1 Tax=Zizania palustris TaxID=103762 RepID=A0A8J5VX83_ZIZPA|nr:hypothetical protein GUJ93_ZPchr0006g42436 [Zizania palustris]